uniref:Uncharacterized protein n=1 Tax=Hyaloperonospora arabidopsidis (strain Emoy2) TaxID=559515 RepID=M4B8N5_HYAAE
MHWTTISSVMCELRPTRRVLLWRMLPALEGLDLGRIVWRTTLSRHLHYAPRVSPIGAGAHRAKHAIRCVVSLPDPNEMCYTHRSGTIAEKDRQVDSGRHYRVHADQGRLAQCAELEQPVGLRTSA